MVSLKCLVCIGLLATTTLSFLSEEEDATSLAHREEFLNNDGTNLDRRFGPWGGNSGNHGDETTSRPWVVWVPSDDEDNTHGTDDDLLSADSLGPDFDIDRARRIRSIHAVLAAVSVVAVFPVGAILLRILPGRRTAVWAHVVMQIVGLAVFIAGVGFGLDLVFMVRIPGGSLMSNPHVRHHPIIGLVVLSLLLLQPFFGLLHHAHFRKQGSRGVWSYAHIWTGRIAIVLGVANGGIGLALKGRRESVKIAYGAVATLVALVWVGVVVRSEVRRRAAEKARARDEVPKWEEVEGVDGDGRVESH